MTSSRLVIPLWTKILALLAGFWIIAVGVGGAIGIVRLRTACLQAVEPLHINATLRRIGNFPDSLLDDNLKKTGPVHPVFGWRVPLTAVDWVYFEQAANPSQFAVAAYRTLDSDPDAVEEIDKLYDLPLLMPGESWLRCAGIVDKGEADIGGHRFHYETVQLKDENGQAYKGMIGAMTVGPKVVVIEGAVPGTKQLDVNFLLDFLRKARGF